MQDLNELRESIIVGDASKARCLTDAALAQGIEPLIIVREAMIPAMNEVGRRYECVEFFVPELILAARATKLALEPIRPLLAASGAESSGRVVIGTVKGDMHDIGKNLVSAMLEGAGFEVTDLGANVSPEKFVAAVKEKNAQVVALSALLTTTMPAMRATVQAFKDAGLRDRIKIYIGGAPITQKFAEDIGADGYSENAPGAVALVKQAVGVA